MVSVRPRYPFLEQIAPRKWRLLKPVVCIAGEKKIIVPEGFETDGASVPRIFWPICPAWSTYTNAAVVHDYLCVERITKTSKETHKIFLDAMVYLGVTPWRRRIMYRAVMLVGPRW